MAAKAVAEPETMTETEIWRRLETLVHSGIGSYFEQRWEQVKGELKKLFVEAAASGGPGICLDLYTPARAADYCVQSCHELCKEVYSICEEGQRQANIEHSPLFDQTVFFKAIQPKIRAMRELAAIQIKSLGPDVSEDLPDEISDPISLDRLNSELDSLELEWRARRGVQLPEDGATTQPCSTIPDRLRQKTELRSNLQEIRNQATAYFDRVASKAGEEMESWALWSLVSPEDEQVVEKLSSRIHQTCAAISYEAGPLRMVGQAGQTKLGIAMDRMVNALKFRWYVHRDTQVVTDEDRIVAVIEGRDEERPILTVAVARSIFMDNYSTVVGFLDLVEAPKPTSHPAEDVHQFPNSPVVTAAPPETQNRVVKATRERGPVIETIRERVQFEDNLRSELAAIHPLVKTHTLQGLRLRFPKFELWKLLSDTEQQELLTDPFKPRQYAQTLTARKYGVSKWAIEKYRPRLRQQT